MCIRLDYPVIPSFRHNHAGISNLLVSHACPFTVSSICIDASNQLVPAGLALERFLSPS